ncbi:fusion protein [Agrobacterium tumefaciens]|uniref:gp53-like domain-containing protein n=1 Tax=Agrobacterium tumefaciens TaxID=358 RepID=UPI000B3FDF6B|nr:fusion protein [Agrobacterium tumefaciens]OVE92220.1 fusion protein [Agrobacterium tumefaciens]
MANTTWYGDGTATVAVGSRTVTGTDTGWLTEVAGLTPIKVGDKFGIHVGRPIVIEQIVSDTELLLADDWPGPAQTDAPYKIELTNPTIVAVETMRRLMLSLSGGNLSSIAETSVGNDDLLIGIGPGVFSTIKKSEMKDGVQFDEAVADLAGRAAYDTAAADFRVLVADIGDGRSAVYIKESAASGDWSVPYYITGTVGPAGVNQRGNYSAGTAYVVRDLVQYGGSTWIAKVATTGNAPPTLPTTENTQWLLFARSGTAGVVDRGTYSGATAYETNDIVLNNGSTWIALQPTTGNAPPALPTESNAYWRLLARKGADGTGTGDVVGPAGGVSDNFPVAFDATTGKLIKAITGAIAALHALTPAADKLPYFSGASAASLADLTAFARTILDDANGAAMFATMGATSGTGWMKLPNGRLMQWGTSTGTTDSGGNLGISFPTSFSSGSSYNVVAWSGDSAVASGNLVLSQLRSAPWPQATGFAVSVRTGNTGAAFASSAIRVDWIAIGVAP